MYGPTLRHHVVSSPTMGGWLPFGLCLASGVRRAGRQAGRAASGRSKKRETMEAAALHGGCVRRGGVVRSSTMMLALSLSRARAKGWMGGRGLDGKTTDAPSLFPEARLARCHGPLPFG